MINDHEKVNKDLDSRRDMDLEELDKLAERYFLPACAGDIKATTTYLKILERRSKLLGLDEPTKIKMEVNTYDVTELNRQLELLEGSTNGQSTPVMD